MITWVSAQTFIKEIFPLFVAYLFGVFHGWTKGVGDLKKLEARMKETKATQALILERFEKVEPPHKPEGFA